MKYAQTSKFAKFERALLRGMLGGGLEYSFEAPKVRL